MKQILGATALAVLLVVGPALPAAAASGGSWGVRGGGGGGHGGGSGGWSGGAPRGSAGGGGGVHTGSGQASHWYRSGSAHGGGGEYHGGGWYGSTQVYVGGVGWWGPAYPYYSYYPYYPYYYPYYPYYPYYATPPVVAPSAPATYIQQAPEPPADAYWYYCQKAGAYYPYVKDCPGGWMQVVPQTVPPGHKPGAPPQ